MDLGGDDDDYDNRSTIAVHDYTQTEDEEALERLLYDVDAPEIALAASGLRPEIHDYDPLPLVDGRLRMAPASAQYKVTRSGEGTEVTLFGTTAEGHTCAVRVNGFYPYIYVHLGSADARKLVAELDATLLEMMAVAGEKHSWSSEYRSVVDTLIGVVRQRGDDRVVLEERSPLVRRVRPIVGWELVDGTLLRGSGDARGYRGLETQRFIKIYFLMPALVPKAKSILHGAHNEFGPLRQAEKLAARGTDMEDRLAAEAANKLAEETKKRVGKEFGRLRYLDAEFAKKWVPHGETGEGDGVESSDDEEGDDVDEGEDEPVLDAVDDEPAVVLEEKDAIRAEQIATTLYEPELQDETFYTEQPKQRPGFEDDPFANAFSDDDDPFSTRRRRRRAPAFKVLGTDANTDEGRERLAKLANDKLHALARDELSATRGTHVTDSYLNAADKHHTFTVCEADIDFILRLAIDVGFSFNQFIEIDLSCELQFSNSHFPRLLDASSTDWSPRDTPPGLPPIVRRAHRCFARDKKTRTTTAQIEIYADFHHLRLAPDVALQRKVPHRVMLSLDSEMETHGSFPQPDTHAVLQVGCVIPLPSGKRREIGFTVGRLARGPGKWIDVRPPMRPQAPITGEKRVRGEDTDDEDGQRLLEDDAEILRALTRREFRRSLDADVESEHILSFATETSMLLGLANFVRYLAPDIVLTFNGDNFDMPYLLERSRVLGIGKQFEVAWGASLSDSRLKVRERSFGTTAIGKHVYKEVTAHGRLFYDIFQYWKRNPMLKERSYSLNSLSKRYLDMEKENVAYSQIDTLQSTPQGRRKLLRYCVRDALLPVLLDQRRAIGLDLLEKSRATGVPVEMLLKRGMQIQCKTYLYRKSRIGILIPELARGMPGIVDAGQRRAAFWYTRTDEERRVEMRLGGNDDDGDARSKTNKYEGAVVLDPDRGIHEEPVVTLDFRALYPSIMTSGGYCVSTLIAPSFNERSDAYFNYLVSTGVRSWDELFVTVGTVEYDANSIEFIETIRAGASRFIRHDVLRGFVPDIERELLLWRDAVKAEMKVVKAALGKVKTDLEALEKATPLDQSAVDSLRAEVTRLNELLAVLDKRQLSIKLVANSLYGVFGAKTSFAYCLDLADSVTRRGRAAILFARWLTLFVVNDITPDHPVAREIAKFPGLKNTLVSLDPGKKIVDELCAEMVEARKTKPKRARAAPARTKSQRSQFDAMSKAAQAAKQQQQQAPAAPAEMEVDESVRIKCVYGYEFAFD